MIYHDILETESIRLRALEPSDIELLYAWENDSDIWLVSATIAPFSKDILTRYVENSFQDIYTNKQLRFMIECKISNTTVGSIDLYDFDPHNLRVGIGIFVHPNYLKKGYASQALDVIKNYTSQVLHLNQIYAEITEFNTASLALFKNAGFELNGVKKDWVRTPEGFANEFLLQYLF